MLVLLVFAFVLVGLSIASLVRFRMLAHLPGPLNLPIIGSSYIFFRVQDLAGVWQVINDMKKKMPNVLKVWLGPLPLILCGEYKTLNTVLNSPACLDKGLLFTFFDIMTNGVFIATGKTWEELRKFVNISFGPRHLEEYMDVFNRKSDQLVRKMAGEEGFWNPHVDIGNTFVDIGFWTHWGLETNNLEKDEVKLHETVSLGVEMVVYRMFRPWFYPDFLFFLCSQYRKLIPSRKHIYEYLERNVEERKKLKEFEDRLPEGDQRKRKNVYLDMVAEWAAAQGRTDAYYIQRKAADLVIAASDTTSAIFCQLLYHVAADPQIQDKLQEEIDALYPGEDVHVTKGDLKELVYTEMVIKETLRLYSPPNTTRYIGKDLQTEIGLIPKGCTVGISVFQVQRDPQFWSHPNDFRPDHFTPEAEATRPKGAYMPFLLGPRNCPGKIYAYWLLKVLAVHVFKKFRVETDMKDVKHKFTFIIVPIDGFSLKFVPRT